MYHRLCEGRIREALTDTPAILLVGPRRAGKTTLVREIGGRDRPYITLDDQTALAAARSDPAGFVQGLDHVIIDEIQRVPDLLLAIKKSIDEDGRPGRFILTGSANVMTLSTVADSLAGRMETFSLLPLARAEVIGRAPTFLARVFDGTLSPGTLVRGDDLLHLVLTGGYPEAMARTSERRRLDWARAYLASILTRDLRDIATVEKLTELPKFLRIVAQHAGQMINYSAIGAGIAVDHKTSQRYLGLLERIFVISVLQPWYTNRVKRIVKTPKLHFSDSGLLATVRGLTFDQVRTKRDAFGALLESFVYAEIQKLTAGSGHRLTPYHFRDHEKRDVDLVLERDDGQIVGIEVKASATVKPTDFVGLRTLAAACGDAFAFGVVLYDSADVVPFGDRLAAVPISCLWT